MYQCSNEYSNVYYGEIFWLKLAKILLTNFIVDVSDLHPSSGQFAFTMSKIHIKFKTKNW